MAVANTMCHVVRNNAVRIGVSRRTVGAWTGAEL